MKASESHKEHSLSLYQNIDLTVNLTVNAVCLLMLSTPRITCYSELGAQALDDWTHFFFFFFFFFFLHFYPFGDPYDMFMQLFYL